MSEAKEQKPQPKPQGEKAPAPEETDFRENIRTRPATPASKRLGEAVGELEAALRQEFKPLCEPVLRLLAQLLEGRRARCGS